MALNLVDRVLTVAVTATLTSAAWIVALSGTEREAPSPPVPAREARDASAPPAAPVSPNRTWVVPVAGIAPDRLTDTFDDVRGGGTRTHEALDIPAPAGTAVVAAAPGTVEELFVSDEGGNTIYIRSSDRRMLHYYAHLQNYAPGLRKGAPVERGQRLGSVGSSGNADPAAPHLHFAIMRTSPDAEWWEPAEPVNPYSMLRTVHTTSRSAAGNP